MQQIDIDDVESGEMGDADRLGVSDALETEDMSLNHYALEPDEAFSGGLHTHLDKEEVFYIVEGPTTFEVQPKPDAESEIVRRVPGKRLGSRPESISRVATNRTTTWSHSRSVRHVTRPRCAFRDPAGSAGTTCSPSGSTRAG